LIARKSFLMIVVNIINGILSYVALYFITKYMTPADYGIVSFAMGFVALFTIIGELGFTNAHIKKISEGKDLGKCNGTFGLVRLVFTPIMIVVVLVSTFLWNNVLGKGFETPEHLTAIYIMLVYWVLRAIANYFLDTLKAKREIAKTMFPTLFESTSRVIVTIYIALGGYGAIALALTHIVGNTVLLIFSVLFFKGNPIKKYDIGYLKEYYKYSVPMIIVVASSIIISNIDKVFIQFFWSAEDVGYYFSGFRMSTFIMMFTTAVGTLLFPTFSELHSNGNTSSIKELIHVSERYLSMIVFPMVFIVIVLARPITKIMLSGWYPVVPILQIVTLHVLFLTLERPYQSHFLGSNRPKLVRNRIVIMVIFNLILNALLVPTYGAVGAGVATTMSYFMGLLYSRIRSYTILKTKFNVDIIKHLFSALIMSLVLYYMIDYIIYWYHLIIVSLIGFAVYMFVLVLLKEFNKDDFYFVLETINVKKMFGYIRGEFKNNKSIKNK